MVARLPSLRAIAAFEASARLGGFARVAVELNPAQSTVSHAIRSLKKRLGQSRFNRLGNNLERTAEGPLLAGRVRRGLNILDDAFDVKPWAAIGARSRHLS